MAEIVRYLQDKKFRLPLKLSTAQIAPKVCEASLNIWLTNHNFQNFIKIVHFRRSYSRTRESRSFGPQSNP